MKEFLNHLGLISGMPKGYATFQWYGLGFLLEAKIFWLQGSQFMRENLSNFESFGMPGVCDPGVGSKFARNS